MENTSIEILLIEDNPDDAFLIKNKIKKAVSLSTFNITNSERLGDGINKLKEEYFDLVLLDLSLPDSSGIDSFHKILNEGFNIPIIVLTGLQDEETALKIVHMGAQDYLVKGTMDGYLLVRSILYAIERHQVIQQLKREIIRRESAFEINEEKEFEIRELSIRHTTLMNATGNAVIETDSDFTCIGANKVAKKLLGNNIIGERVCINTKEAEDNNIEPAYISLCEKVTDLNWERADISDSDTIKIGNLYIGNIKDS